MERKTSYETCSNRYKTKMRLAIRSFEINLNMLHFLPLIVILVYCNTMETIACDYEFRYWKIKHEQIEAKFFDFIQEEDAKSGVRLETKEKKSIGISWWFLSTSDRKYLREIYESRNYKSYGYENDITLATRLGATSKVKSLIKSKKVRGLLLYAAEGGDADMIAFLLKEGYNPKLRTTAGETLLHIAARCGNLDAVICFVENCDFDINSETVGVYRTPLYYAAEGGHLDVVKYLVQNGADILAFNGKLGTTSYPPLSWRMSEKLFGQDRGESSPGFYLLYAAVHSGNIELVDYLIRSGANYIGTSGETILDTTGVKNISVDMLTYLKENHGVVVQEVSSEPETPVSDPDFGEKLE